MENKIVKKKTTLTMSAIALVTNLWDKEYEPDDVLAMLSRGNYEEFSMPVKMYKKQMYGVDAEKDYGLTVGYVQKYDAETKTFEFTVNEKNHGLLSKLAEEFCIVPKVSFKKDGKPRKILDLFLYPIEEDE